MGKKQTTNRIYRQGDVLITFLGSNEKPHTIRRTRKDGILLHGEATGHAHRIADMAAAEVYDVDAGCFLCVSASGGVSITHDEHAAILLPAGMYRVTRQREYSPEAISNVID
jgi:hypothetical protein